MEQKRSLDKIYTDTCDFLNNECMDDFNCSELKEICSADVFAELMTIRLVDESEYISMCTDGVIVLETSSNLYVRTDIGSDFIMYSRECYTVQDAVNDGIYDAIKWSL